MTEVFISLFAGVVAIFVVALLASSILKKPRGTRKMEEISELIQEGATAFLLREYKSIAIFVLILAVILFFGIAKKTAISFICGAFSSILAGWIGMKIATKSNCRAAQACSISLNEGLRVAFPGGMVMGLSVAGLGLFGLSLVFLILYWHAGLREIDVLKKLIEVSNLIVGFSMGASSVALFARVGGGIYTKAADVGADLVGKVEAGIPEDDPRNPAVIADNVGDNVGDVAGMGADLFESYIGAIISGIVISIGNKDVKGMALVFLIAAWGIISSILGLFFVRSDEKTSPQKALRLGMWSSALILIIGSFLIILLYYKNLNVFISLISGLIAGLVVGFTAEVFTSGKKVQDIAISSKTGPATNILAGIATGMKSVIIPIVVIGIATIISYKFAKIFGIAISALGMLSITGITVAVDAYGPIADNAAGIAEMAGMGKEVRERAEKLDAVGNTTAAIGKGFAIGSAALTALALFSAYAQTVELPKMLDGTSVINVLNPYVIAGLFIGGIIPFFFSASTMQAVGKTAFKVVEEVRRQFREIPGLMEGTAKPDSAKCVDITTKGALKEMLFPGISAVIIPFLIGIILGPEALGGFLAGSLITGVPLALFLANSGGAWDNAKKYVEEGNLGGKGSDVHKATVIGDTVGDPFKDTSGPSLNILLKLMSIVSLVFAPLIVKINSAILKIF